MSFVSLVNICEKIIAQDICFLIIALFRNVIRNCY